MVGTDLFELKGQQYLVVVDYYPECIKLSRTTSAQVLKAIFARHGIPETDNGPQFSSRVYTICSNVWV